MKLKPLSLRFIGQAPIIFHNIQLANPANDYAKAIKRVTSIQTKNRTDADIELLQKAEFQGGLYLDENLEPIIPDDVVTITLINGARKHNKSGKKAEAGLWAGHAKLIYDGPRDIESLWLDNRFHYLTMVSATGKKGGPKVMRMRPIFHQWSAECVVQYDSELINPGEVLSFCERAGGEVGFCERRPRFGRFVTELIE